jgi:hypothetical protein
LSIRTRISFTVAVVVAVLVAATLFFARNCPSTGFALTDHARRLHRLKNRIQIPQASDFDSRVSLNALLEPGNDTDRWSTESAARISGYVVDVAYARPEATNCYVPFRRDLHILVANRKDAAKAEQIVLEITPNIRDWASQRGLKWSESTLQTQLIGHRVEFEGWLYFDEGHAEDAENTAPGNPTNWRATAWEIHPVTGIRVLE